CVACRTFTRGEAEATAAVCGGWSNNTKAMGGEQQAELVARRVRFLIACTIEIHHLFCSPFFFSFFVLLSSLAATYVCLLFGHLALAASVLFFLSLSIFVPGF
ncbi:unnamed protein product, partial [Pylaiella littoralis]